MYARKRTPDGWLVKKTAAGMKKQKDSVIENNIEKAGLAKLSPAFPLPWIGKKLLIAGSVGMT